VSDGYGLEGSDGVGHGKFIGHWPAGILSNVVTPGSVLTERNERVMPPEYKEQVRQHLHTRQLPTPEDVAAVIVFLGSQVNRQITGEVLRITGRR
jgi:3-oxoacyl-[acyl-carrier protein] reductase